MRNSSRNKDELYKHENSMEKCNVCDNKIPAKIFRKSFSAQTRYGLQYRRICARCILKMAGRIKGDKECMKEVRKWTQQLAAEAI